MAHISAGERRGDGELIISKLAPGGGGGSVILMAAAAAVPQYLHFTVTVKHERVPVSLSAGSAHYETIRRRRLIAARNLNL